MHRLENGSYVACLPLWKKWSLFISLRACFDSSLADSWLLSGKFLQKICFSPRLNLSSFWHGCFAHLPSESEWFLLKPAICIFLSRDEHDCHAANTLSPKVVPVIAIGFCIQRGWMLGHSADAVVFHGFFVVLLYYHHEEPWFLFLLPE